MRAEIHRAADIGGSLLSRVRRLRDTCARPARHEVGESGIPWFASRSPDSSAARSDRAAMTVARANRIDPHPCLADEGDELHDLGDRAEVGLDPIECVALGPPFLEEDPERRADAPIVSVVNPARRRPIVFRPVTQL